MKARTFLQGLRTYDSRINAKLEEIQHLKDLAYKITSTLGKESVSGTKNNDKLGTIVSKLSDLENEINEEIDRYIDYRVQADQMVHQIQDHLQGTVLIMRYFNGDTWETIAEKLGQSERNVYYLHGYGLKAFQELIDKKAEEDPDSFSFFH